MFKGASPKVVFEDGSHFVFHRDDLGRSYSVLSTPGYGEVSQTPDLRWSDGAETENVVCARCCSSIGFSSVGVPSAVRLLKHRVGTKRAHGDITQHTFATFVAQQLVRYAECKAVYNVIIKSVSSNFGLEIMLVSWNLEMAVADNTFVEDGVGQLAFRPAIKVIFEESAEMCDIDTFQGAKPIFDKPDDCCWRFQIPTTQPKQGKCLVITVEEREVQELRRVLRCNEQYIIDKALVRSLLQVRMATKRSPERKKLSVLELI